MTRPDAVMEAASGADIFDLTTRRILLSGYLAIARFIAGSPEAGVAALRRAHESTLGGDPFMFGMTMVNLGRIYALRGDPLARVREAAETVLANPGAIVWHVHATLLLEWVKSVEAPETVAPVDDVVSRFRERIEAFPLGAPYAAMVIVDTLRRAGHPARALAFLDEMLAVARRTGERLFEPELIRMRGELLEPSDRALALTCYREAFTLASTMGAWTLALRAATNIARLSGDLAPLATSLPHITDGAHTPDVLEAHRLLA
jgi:hypothetical protein